VLTVASISAAQDKVFEWIKASDEAAQLDPMDYHAGRVYHPADSGGNMHVDIHARMPVTIAMAPNDEWIAVTQHPEQPPRLDGAAGRGPCEALSLGTGAPSHDDPDV